MLRSSSVLNECNLSRKIVKNEKKNQLILSEVCTINKERLIVLFTSYVMYKKYKRLVYRPSDLSARFCKVNLSNTKNPA